MTTWKEQLHEAADGDEIIACTLNEEQLQVEFDNGFGGEEGVSFTAWSKAYVYFPACHDGAEWVGRAPRDPGGEATEHQGG